MAYRYLNVNSLGLKEEDCVNRAIATASGRSYADIQDKLYYIGQLYECQKLEVTCYAKLIEDVLGFERLPERGMTVGELSHMYPNDILLIRIAGHLTVSVYSDIRDLWDCSDEIVDIAWIRTDYED